MRQFWGKIFGTVFGYLLFRQAGAALGLLIGHYFDQGLMRRLKSSIGPRDPAARRAYFNATFLVMGYLAKIDGRVNEAEIECARNIMQRSNLNQSLNNDAIKLFNRGKVADFNLAAVLEGLWQASRGHPGLVHLFIETLLELALIDGDLNNDERRLLLLVCQHLHCPPQLFEELRSSHSTRHSFYQGWQSSTKDQRKANSNTNSLDQAYAVLGVSSSDNIATIKKAYRKLMNQHHPDKMVAKGLPAEMLKLAQEKTQQISAAYDAIREARGFR